MSNYKRDVMAKIKNQAKHDLQEAIETDNFDRIGEIVDTLREFSGESTNGMKPPKKTRTKSKKAPSGSVLRGVDVRSVVLKFVEKNNGQVSTREIYDYFERTVKITPFDKEFTKHGLHPRWKKRVSFVLHELRRERQLTIDDKGTWSLKGHTRKNQATTLLPGDPLRAATGV